MRFNIKAILKFIFPEWQVVHIMKQDGFIAKRQPQQSPIQQVQQTQASGAMVRGGQVARRYQCYGISGHHSTKTNEIKEIETRYQCRFFSPSSDDRFPTEGELARIFTEKGYYFLGGVTQPFRGPYIWKTMDKTNYHVEIPLNQQSVTVYMMSDFILESWISYIFYFVK